MAVTAAAVNTSITGFAEAKTSRFLASKEKPRLEAIGSAIAQHVEAEATCSGKFENQAGGGAVLQGNTTYDATGVNKPAVVAATFVMGDWAAETGLVGKIKHELAARVPARSLDSYRRTVEDVALGARESLTAGMLASVNMTAGAGGGITAAGAITTDLIATPILVAGSVVDETAGSLAKQLVEHARSKISRFNKVKDGPLLQAIALGVAGYLNGTVKLKKASATTQAEVQGGGTASAAKAGDLV